MKKIALFDLDGSLADYEGALVRDLERLRFPGEPATTRETIWEHENNYAHVKARMDLIKQSRDWWFGLHSIPSGFAVKNTAEAMGFDIHILTKGPRGCPKAWSEKLEWCQVRMSPDIKVHITCDKGMVYGHVLFDDFPAYMDRWINARPRGLGIMPVTAHNKDYNHPRVIKFDGSQLGGAELLKVKKAMQTVLDREPGKPLVLGG